MRRPVALPPILLAFLTLFVYTRLDLNAAHTTLEATTEAMTEAQRRQTRGARGRARQAARRPRVDYSKFSHVTGAHRLACDSCHRSPTPNWMSARAEDSFPDVTDYPDHPSCVRCHRQQFFAGARPPICSVCHTKVSPRDGARFVFQNPSGTGAARGVRKPEADSQFATRFPHDKHQDVMASLPRGRAEESVAVFVRASFQSNSNASVQKRIDSCSICHQTYDPQGASDEEEMRGRPQNIDPKLWPKKGTFKTTPTDHSSCFNCHWQEGGVEPLSSDCAGCHSLRPPGVMAAARRERTDAELKAASAFGDAEVGAKWLRRESARFRHEIERHDGLGCTSCHVQITSLNTLDVNTLEVPILTCGGASTSCHIGPKPKRILNEQVDKRRADPSFQCDKCHISYGREPTPKSHSDAVPAPKP